MSVAFDIFITVCDTFALGSYNYNSDFDIDYKNALESIEDVLSEHFIAETSNIYPVFEIMQKAKPACNIDDGHKAYELLVSIYRHLCKVELVA